MPVDDIAVAPPAASRADRRRARIALVLGLLPLPPLWLGAVPLAVRTMRRVPSGSSTFAVAVAAMSAVFGWMCLSFMVAVIAAAWFVPVEPEPTDPAPTGDAPFEVPDVAPERVAGEPGSVHVNDLLTGDCYNDEGAFNRLEVVPCTAPHDEQVYGVSELIRIEYPGADRILELADERCGEMMTDRIQQGWDSGELGLSHFAPGSSLAYAGDKRIVCVAGTEVPRTESLLESAP